MAAEAGYKGKLWITGNSTAPGDDTNLIGVTEATLTTEKGEIDISTIGEGQFMKYIQGMINGTLTFSFPLDVAKAIHLQCMADVLTEQTRWFHYSPNGLASGAGALRYNAEGFITSIGPSSNTTDANTVSVNVRLTGTIALATS